jgi:thiamine biosynthesis protein ThiS
MDRMQLHINGEDKSYDAPLTLGSLLAHMGLKSDRVAVELNRDIVPRDEWDKTSLSEGDRLEIVHFVGGGKR